MKKNIKLVSILIINYNNAKYLERAIKSCLNQTYKNIEILIFDDKSKDNSREKILKYKLKKNIKYYFNKKSKKNIPALDAFNGYDHLFKKSKGQIISLLDSDDFFKKDKIARIVKLFDLKKDLLFVQNLPIEINKHYSKKKKNKNHFISYWPYLAPESCISFKREFYTEFIKVNFKYKNIFQNVWLGFRLGVFSYFVKKNFYCLNEHLTFYEALGQSGLYKKFNSLWFYRRLQSFNYIYNISKKNIIHKLNIDYILTLILSFITNIFNNKKNA